MTVSAGLRRTAGWARPWRDLKRHWWDLSTESGQWGWPICQQTCADPRLVRRSWVRVPDRHPGNCQTCQAMLRRMKGEATK